VGDFTKVPNAREGNYCVSNASLYQMVLGLCLMAGCCSSKAAEATVDQHIAHVRDRIPPAIIVVGEPLREMTLTARMAALHVPGVSLAVIHNGRVDWARGFGVTQVDGPSVNEETLFQAASISKPVTALAVLRLVQSGVLDLDTDVNTYLKSWKIPENEFTASHKVTLRELLSHTAGVTVDGFGGYSSKEPLPSLLQTLDGLPPANNMPVRVDQVPGSQWRYAGGGYVILRQILMDMTGQSFGQFMLDKVLGPIGMPHSRFEQPLSPEHLTHAAMPANEAGRALKLGPRIYPELAPDGLWTTASDLAHYVIEVQRSLAGRPGSLLCASTARLMLTPILNHWGLGPIVGDDEQHPYFTHSGGNVGFISILVAYNQGDGAVILTNGSGRGAYHLAIDVIRSIAQEYNWPGFKPVRHRTVAMAPESLDRDVGVYQTAADAYIVVTRETSQLFVHATGEPKILLLSLGKNQFVEAEATPLTFLPRADELYVSFKADANGSAGEIDLRMNGVTQAGSGKRLPATKAETVIQRMATLERRYEAQQPTAQSEPALRRLLNELVAGKPDYDRMTPEIAKAVSSVVALDQQLLSPLGPVVSISFRRMAPDGVDTFHIAFKNGEADFEISVNEAGKIQHALYLPD
jgi:CubicO group peptidase (beta-lactamase class C family)